MHPPTRKNLIAFLIIALAAVVFGVAFCFNLARSPYEKAAASLPAELKAAKAEGLTLEPEELNQTPHVPDERNAALLYQQINLANISAADEDALAAVRKPNPTAAVRKTAALVIRKAEPALALAEKAAELPGCDFHRNWALGPDLMLPEYVVLRKTTRILAAKATMQVDAGHPEEALRTIRIGARITYHLGDEPILIPFLVRIALEAIMDQPLRHLVCRYADRPEILRLARETNRAFDRDLDIERALRGEVVMCRIITKMLRTGETDDFYGYNHRLLLLSRRTVADSYEAHSISFWRKTYAAMRSNQSDLMAQYRAILAVANNDDTRKFTKTRTAKPSYEMNETLTPLYYQAAFKVVGTEARRRIRKTMFAMFDYRHSHGRFPARLADLTAAQLPDPFTGKPLGYRSNGSTFTLYSVGENLIDDGGSSKRPKKGDQPLDIVATYP